MKNREIKFRIWFNEPGAPPQMIYPHIDDFIYNSDANAIGRAFLDCDYQKGLKVYYQVVMNPDNCKKDALGLLDNTIHEATGSVLMEYAGLSDKNTSELYEGDVVLFDNSTLNYLIEYSEGRFYGSWQSKWNAAPNEMITGQSGVTHWFNWEYVTDKTEPETDGYPIYPTQGVTIKRTSKFVVLGNRYQNPELLVDDQIEEIPF